MGGEKIIWASVSIAALESPPHGRGKGVVEGGHVEVNRITPAWAGKSLVTPSIPRARGDHPRVGGEKCRSATAAAAAKGSPPRGRGKEVHLSDTFSNQRITPAWAGKRRPAGLRAVRPRDHPRVGGEKLSSRLLSIPVQGSPPRGRGKDSPCIPRQRQAEDHPRVGGEKWATPTSYQARPGSPPRGRGKA